METFAELYDRVAAYGKSGNFDPKCLELANHIIDDHPHLRSRAEDLAIEIAGAISDWLLDQEQIQRIDDKVREIAEG